MTKLIKIFPALFLLIFLHQQLPAQQRYWIFFHDKHGVSFDPYKYFSETTIRKRLLRGESLFSYSDLPVSADYIRKVEDITGKNTITESRWFNAIAVAAGPSEISTLRKQPFIKEIIPVSSVSYTAEKVFREDIDSVQSCLLSMQLSTMGEKYFAGKNIDGKGVRIAVFDAGFPGVDTSPLFEHLRKEHRIIATYDFIKKDTFVYGYVRHGTSVLTCIAGKLGDKKFGLATGAEFLLARTEITPAEKISEEENWVAAMEWAYRNGADIINSSLGYTYKRYFPVQMDGKYSMITRAANMAAAKGMLVVNAAGNDGDKHWKVIGAPADADSVLSTGGISPMTGMHIAFSSFGPTSDGRLKPNVCAFAQVTTSNEKKITTSYGTSFSAPLVSGFAACVMQMHPEWSNMNAFEEIEKSGHLYPYFDYAHGFGVPQADYFTGEKSEPLRSFSFIPGKDTVVVKIVKDNEEHFNNCSGGIYDLDKDHLYFRISYEGNHISRYGVVDMKDADSFPIPLKKAKHAAITVYFRKFVESYSF